MTRNDDDGNDLVLAVPDPTARGIPFFLLLGFIPASFLVDAPQVSNLNHRWSTVNRSNRGSPVMTLHGVLADVQERQQTADMEIEPRYSGGKFVVPVAVTLCWLAGPAWRSHQTPGTASVVF